MISFEVFLIGLLAVSTLTGLATEAIKLILAEHNVKYHSNTLSGIVALVLSVVVGICYIVFTGITFSAQIVVALVALVFGSWLCAMVGYDKVVQIITQFKKKG